MEQHDGRSVVAMNYLSTEEERRRSSSATAEPAAKPAPDPEGVLRVKHLSAIIKNVVEAVGGYSNERLAAAIAPLLQRIEALEAAVPEYTGVHVIGHEYRRNQLCTFNGSLFIALRTTSTSPPSDDWRCCVKRGRDGRDGRDRFVDAPPQPTRLQ